jgi:RNA polymerase-binding transcription factor DksA
MNKDKINYYKDKLEKEKLVLESELKTVAHVNPNNPNDWEASYTNTGTDGADMLEVADEIEGYQNNVSILNSLETRYNEVLKALEDIENGRYGICEVSGEAIEEDRLEANPAARTCKEHMNK